ncbi:hypothetical protein ACFL1M_03910 [Patescibacteria group bacterium]
MTDPAQHAMHSDPSGFVNEMLQDAEERLGEDMYLDNLRGPNADDLANMKVEEDLEEKE